MVGRNAPLDFEVGGRLAVELTARPRFGQRQVAAGGGLTGLQLRVNDAASQKYSRHEILLVKILQNVHLYLKKNQKH